MTSENRSRQYLNTDLAKSVATTASAIVNSAQSGKGLNGTSNNLIQNKTFQKVLGDTINNNKNQSLIQKHSTPKANENSMIPLIRRSKIINKLKKDFNIIPEELLHDIPRDDNIDNHQMDLSSSNDSISNNTVTVDASFSLFQGFNAALPEIDETLERFKEGSSRLLTYENSNNNSSGKNPLPKGMTVEKIQNSQNFNQLTKFQQEINYKLDLIEIRKGLSANEIREIDSKVDRLYEMRNSVFNKIKEYEQSESYLEDQLREIELRMELVKDIENLESLQDENVIIDEDEEHQTGKGPNSSDMNKTDDEGDDESLQDALLSKSIYGKLKKSTKVQKKKVSRKHKPTLQQYYKPGSLINEFKAHEDSITCFGFDSPFGTMVTASLDNTVRVWDMNRYKCTGLLESHLSSVKCLQMQDNLVMTGSLDATLKLWDINKLSNDDLEDDNNSTPLLHTFESHVEEITALNFNNTTFVSGSSDRTIRQWDLNTGHCLQTIDVLWASSMMNIGNGNIDETSKTYQLRQQQQQKQQRQRYYPFIGALQCYDAALASGTADGIVRLWDLRSGEVIRQLIGHTGPVTCLQFDDRNLTTGSADRSIRIWDLRTGGILDSFSYDSPITTLQFDQSKIVSTNCENSVKIYDRIEERHWICGGDEKENEDGGKRCTVEYARYQEGYMVEGRQDGMIGVWAI